MIRNSIILTLLALSSTVVQSRWFWGKCPNFHVQSDFDLNNYAGQWFEQARDIDTFYEKGDCVHGKYVVDDEGFMRITNAQFDLEKREHTIAEGRAICTGAYCYSRFHNMIDLFGDYQILSTDYSKYAIVYTCSNFLDVFSNDKVWLLTREANVSQEVLSEIHETLWKQHSDYGKRNFYYTQQGGKCDYSI
eukprot:403344790